MRFITGIFDKLQKHPKRVVFPDGKDPRIIQTARQFFVLRMGIPILLGGRSEILHIADEMGVSLKGIRIIDPSESDDLNCFTRRFEVLRGSFVQIGENEARAAMKQHNFFATMMLAMHQADLLVAGGNVTNGAVLRPLLQILNPNAKMGTICGCQIVELEDERNKEIGADGVLLLADCDVQKNPSMEQLAEIALSTARLASILLERPPRVAFLSHTTNVNKTTLETSRQRAASELAMQKARNEKLTAYFDGELQLDTAIIMEIARKKLLPEEMGEVAGRANVLIFPNLDAANIASRIIQYLVRVNVYGDILLGMDRVAAEISRGASAHEILGVTAVMGEYYNQCRKWFPRIADNIPGE